MEGDIEVDPSKEGQKITNYIPSSCLMSEINANFYHIISLCLAMGKFLWDFLSDSPGWLAGLSNDQNHSYN